ncbi:Uncharacterised protein [Enterobacter cloacae]|nr:Uncharacterised protein [Enterobacter cloacae]
MENHQRQHHHPNDRRREKNIGHWDPVGQALFRSAKYNGDFIGLIEAAFAGHKDVNRDDNGQQNDAYHQASLKAV